MPLPTSVELSVDYSVASDASKASDELEAAIEEVVLQEARKLGAAVADRLEERGYRDIRVRLHES